VGPRVVRRSRHHKDLDAVAGCGEHGQRVPRVHLSVWIQDTRSCRLVSSIPDVREGKVAKFEGKKNTNVSGGSVDCVNTVFRIS
jgi:hypothetical protein